MTTAEEIVTTMESKYGQAQRIWVMDRSMVSEKNLEFLRFRKTRNLLGTPKSQVKAVEQALLEKEGWHEVQDWMEAHQFAHPDGEGDEQFVLCRSHARAEKERAMLGRQSARLCMELSKVAATLRRDPQVDREQLGRRIGRCLGKYPAVVEVQVKYDARALAVDLILSSQLELGCKKERRHGAYLLRINCTEKDPAQLWRWYNQLCTRRRRRSVGPNAIWDYAQSITRRPTRCRRTSWCASWCWDCGGHWSNG